VLTIADGNGSVAHVAIHDDQTVAMIDLYIVAAASAASVAEATIVSAAVVAARHRTGSSRKDRRSENKGEVRSTVTVVADAPAGEVGTSVARSRAVVVVPVVDALDHVEGTAELGG